MPEDTAVITNQTELKWQDLNTDQKNAVLCLAMAKNVTEASKLWKTTTGQGKTKFFMYVYPTIKDIWTKLAPSLPDEALRVLHGGSIAAAYELTKEVTHVDVKIRNKASNDVLDRVLPRAQTQNNLTINNQQNNFISLTDFMSRIGQRVKNGEE